MNEKPIIKNSKGGQDVAVIVAAVFRDFGQSSRPGWFARAGCRGIENIISVSWKIF